MTESGIVSCPVNPEQYLNAEEPIEVTESPKTIDVIEEGKIDLKLETQ